jgi:hypothetical protein
MTRPRPSHAAQQQAIDDALAALPSQKFRWLFTPDPKWLAAVNTNTYREVNAVRMFVLVTVVWNGVASAVIAYALGRCRLELGILGTSETVAVVRRMCEESTATAKLLDFAAGVYNSYGLLLAAAMGIAVGGMWLKRKTDTEHNVRIEEAKKAPVIQQVLTSEHPAQPPKQEVNVNVGDKADVEEKSEP